MIGGGLGDLLAGERSACEGQERDLWVVDERLACTLTELSIILILFNIY